MASSKRSYEYKCKGYECNCKICSYGKGKCDEAYSYRKPTPPCGCFTVDCDPPKTTFGCSGDTYLDIKTGIIYKKAGSSWIQTTMNIKDSQPCGAFCAQPGVPDNAVATTGDTYLDITTGIIYRKVGDEWVPTTENINETRPSFYADCGVPSDSLGLDGDTYLDIETGSFYKKCGGTWVATGKNINESSPVSVDNNAYGRISIPEVPVNQTPANNTWLAVGANNWTLDNDFLNVSVVLDPTNTYHMLQVNIDGVYLIDAEINLASDGEFFRIRLNQAPAFTPIQGTQSYIEGNNDGNSGHINKIIALTAGTAIFAQMQTFVNDSWNVNYAHLSIIKIG